jgi:capsular polysaccharide biosynthesis protein
MAITRESADQPTGWAIRMREVVYDLPEVSNSGSVNVILSASTCADTLIVDCFACSQEHYETLKILVNFLRTVVDREGENRMNVQALSVVMAPNLLRGEKSDAVAALAESKLCEIAVRLLITHHDAVFP